MKLKWSNGARKLVQAACDGEDCERGQLERLEASLTMTHALIAKLLETLGCTGVLTKAQLIQIIESTYRVEVEC